MITIDVQTLLIVSTLVLVVLGVFFLVSWVQDRSDTALLHWATAYLITAPATVLIVLRGQIPEWASLVVANAVVILAYGLNYSGALAFDGIRRGRFLALGGAMVWLALCLVPEFRTNFSARVFVVAATTALYTGAAARVIWNGRHTLPLPSRTMGAVSLGLMSVLQAARSILALTAPVSAQFNSINNSWMATVATLMLIQTVINGYLFLSLAKERVASRLGREAMQDHLTGSLTRRAFTEKAERRLAEAPESCALLFFDLDRFKRINDEHGHAVGDRVLIAFADCALAHCEDGDLFGRWGGEEFVLMTSGRDPIEAHRRAEAIRRSFARATPAALGEGRSATVSVGVALSALTGGDLDRLVASADAGLYAAKAAGRDRVAAGPVTIRGEAA